MSVHSVIKCVCTRWYIVVPFLLEVPMTPHVTEDDMNPDFQDPKLCICGEDINLDVDFCSSECEADFYDVQAAMHYTEQVLLYEWRQGAA